MFELAAAEGTPELWLAAGVWLTNQVLIYQPGSDEPVSVSLGAHQPRSLLVTELGGSAHLLVGTATGELLCWALAAARRWPFGPAELCLEPSCWVRVGSSSVDLQLLPALGAGKSGRASLPRCSSALAGPRVLARADQALLLEAHPLLPGQLQATRLHGGAGLADAVPFQADALPPGSLAWVAPGGRLTLGRLDGAPALRWDEVQLGATPALAAFHAGSGCAAVACGAEPTSDAGGSLKLVDLRAPVTGSCGVVVGQVDLTPGHVVSSVASLMLPCSSGGSGKSSERLGCKEFLLVASCLEGTPAAAEVERAQEQAPLRCEEGEPWWRRLAAFSEALPQRDGGGNEPSGAAAAAVGTTSAAAAATAARPAETLALMSVFEVQRQACGDVSPTATLVCACDTSSGTTAATTSGGRQPFRLVLHGTMPLPAACYCLATVEPSAEVLDSPGHGKGDPGPAATSAAGQEQEQGPLLLAGCHDGLRLFRIHVDDASHETAWVLEQSLAAVTVVDPLHLDDDAPAPPPAAAEGAPAAAVDGGWQGSGGYGEQPLEEPAAAARLWHQRVAMQLLSSVSAHDFWYLLPPACTSPVHYFPLLLQSPTHDHGIVANVSVHGSTVFASGLTGGLTAFSVRPPGLGLLPALVPCAADEDCLDWRSQAPALGLSDWQVLAPSDDRLGLLNRSNAAEQRHRELVALRAERAGQPPPLILGLGPRSLPAVEDAANLVLTAASCRLQLGCGGGLAALAKGCLGVHVCPLEDFIERTGGSECASADSGSSSSIANRDGSTSAVFLARNGKVGAIACLAEDDAQVVSRLQLLLVHEDGQAQDPGIRGLLAPEPWHLAEACLRDEAGLCAELQRVGAAAGDLRRCREILLGMCPTACWPTMQ